MKCWSSIVCGLLALAASSAPSRAQPGGAAPASRTEPIFPPVQLSKMGLEEGLPQVHVTALTQDLQGFLWIGTAHGLARYDGARIATFDANLADATALSSPFIAALAADPSGGIWIGTGDADLNYFDPATNKFRRYTSAADD